MRWILIITDPINFLLCNWHLHNANFFLLNPFEAQQGTHYYYTLLLIPSFPRYVPVIPRNGYNITLVFALAVHSENDELDCARADGEYKSIY